MFKGNLSGIGVAGITDELSLSSRTITATGASSQIARLERSVFKIAIERDNYTQFGSGVVIQPDGLALTAAHVLKVDASKRWKPPYAEVSVVRGDEFETRRVPFKILNVSDKDDLALLKLSDRFTYKAATFAADGPTKHDPVYSFGFPGMEKRLSAGATIVPLRGSEGAERFKSYRRISHRLSCRAATLISGIVGGNINAGNIVSTNSIDRGNSGGALLNERGQLIGIVTAYKNLRADRERMAAEFSDITGVDLSEFNFPDRIAISKPLTRCKQLM